MNLFYKKQSISFLFLWIIKSVGLMVLPQSLYALEGTVEPQNQSKIIELSDNLSDNQNTLQNTSKSLFNGYLTRFRTALFVYSAQGLFYKTTEEPANNFSEIGFAGDIGLRDSLYSLKFDLNFKKRLTSSGALKVENTFREYRLFLRRSFPFYLNNSLNQNSQQFSLFVSLGLGLLQPETKITVLQSSKSLKSQTYLLESAQAGFQLNVIEGFLLELFFQSSFSPPYPKNNILSLGVGLGVHF